jgi:hypothetical protein
VFEALTVELFSMMRLNPVLSSSREPWLPSAAAESFTSIFGNTLCFTAKRTPSERSGILFFCAFGGK